MMDTVAIEAIEQAVHPGLPVGAGAVLLVELDGPGLEVELLTEQVEAICREHGASEIRIAADAAERAALWYGRKAAFAAMGRVSPDYYVQDGVVPRTAAAADASSHRRAFAHPRPAGRKRLSRGRRQSPSACALRRRGRGPGRPRRASWLPRSSTACIDAGGSLTGEHGVGVDKACSMPQMYSETDMAVMLRLRTAFDPAGLVQPGKGVSDAAAVRRGTRAVSPASGRT